MTQPSVTQMSRTTLQRDQVARLRLSTSQLLTGVADGSPRAAESTTRFAGVARVPLTK